MLHCLLYRELLDPNACLFNCVVRDLALGGWTVYLP